MLYCVWRSCVVTSVYACACLFLRFECLRVRLYLSCVVACCVFVCRVFAVSLYKCVRVLLYGLGVLGRCVCLLSVSVCCVVLCMLFL